MVDPGRLPRASWRCTRSGGVRCPGALKETRVALPCDDDRLQMLDKFRPDHAGRPLLGLHLGDRTACVHHAVRSDTSGTELYSERRSQIVLKSLSGSRRSTSTCTIPIWGVHGQSPWGGCWNPVTVHFTGQLRTRWIRDRRRQASISRDPAEASYYIERTSTKLLVDSVDQRAKLFWRRYRMVAQ